MALLAVVSRIKVSLFDKRKCHICMSPGIAIKAGLYRKAVQVCYIPIPGDVTGYRYITHLYCLAVQAGFYIPIPGDMHIVFTPKIIVITSLRDVKLVLQHHMVKTQAC